MAMAMAPEPMAWCKDIMSFPEEGPKVAWGSVGHGWRMLDSKKGMKWGLSVEGQRDSETHRQDYNTYIFKGCRPCRRPRRKKRGLRCVFTQLKLVAFP